MKAGKERFGTEPRIRVEKEKGRKVTAILLTSILIMSVLAAYFAYTILSGQFSDKEFAEPTSHYEPENSNNDLKAAIVDQLSLTFPNQTFTETITSALTRDGYTVDYFSGEKVTVELYRDLPLRGYKLIVFRVHSGYDFLFTGEKYTAQSYVQEQLADQVLKAQVSDDADFFFGISVGFIRQCMRSNFTDTVIILMGCNALDWPDLANAFIARGASAVVGWTGAVQSSYTDEATSILLAQYITGKMPLENAVSETMKEMGIDSHDETRLGYYARETKSHFP
jgi:hypothetical protein